VRAGSRRLRDLQVDAVRAAGGRVADAEGRTSELFAADRGLFSDDQFHPSGDGYAVIADALLVELLRALGDEA
jgi:lysophospholipase L1-like esterase